MRSPARAYRLEPASVPPFDANSLRFELLPKLRRDEVRLYLLAGYRALEEAWQFITHLGFVPQTSVRNKLPYYRTTVIARSESVRLSRELQWSLAQQRAHPPRSGLTAQPAGTRPAPHYYWCDAITQHPIRTVGLVNLALVWILFNFDRLV